MSGDPFVAGRGPAPQGDGFAVGRAAGWHAPVRTLAAIVLFAGVLVAAACVLPFLGVAAILVTEWLR